jgi:hypothetical protein
MIIDYSIVSLEPTGWSLECQPLLIYLYFMHASRSWWSWSYFSWIHNYLCNQHLSPLMLWVRISIRARCTTLCDKVYQLLVHGRWFSPGTLASSTTKTGHHDRAEILNCWHNLFIYMFCITIISWNIIFDIVFYIILRTFYETKKCDFFK